MAKSLFSFECDFQFTQAQNYGLQQITLNNPLKQDAYRFSTPNPPGI